MKKISKSIACLALAGMLSIGGIVGCGGDGDGDGGNTALQTQALFAFDASGVAGSPINFAYIPFMPTLILDAAQKAAVIPGIIGGQVEILNQDGVDLTDATDTANATYTDYDNTGCVVINGTAQTVPGAGGFFVSNITTLNLTITPDSGNDFTLTGTSTFDGIESTLTVDITASSSSGDVDIGGTLDVDAATFSASGTLTITEDSTTTECTLVNYAAGTVDAIEDLADACVLDAPTCN